MSPKSEERRCPWILKAVNYSNVCTVVLLSVGFKGNKEIRGLGQNTCVSKMYTYSNVENAGRLHFSASDCIMPHTKSCS